MAAEVVVVVEDEDARGWAGGLAEVPGRGQPADTGAHDHEIVAHSAIGGRARGLPERPVTQRVGDLERAVGTAPQARERGGVRRRSERRLGDTQSERFARREQRSTDGKRDAVQEVAPCDGAVQPELFAAHAQSAVRQGDSGRAPGAANSLGHTTTHLPS